MDPNESHNDPLHEASDRAGQRLVQLIALTFTSSRLLTEWNRSRQRARQERDLAQQRIARERERLDRSAARARWGAAYDKEWLREADVVATARAWSAAVLYAESDAEAAGAAQRCEERLRHLHPAAMRNYDRLRSEGLTPAHAMAQSVPHFAGHPDPHVGQPRPRHPALNGPTGDPADDHAGLRLIDYPNGIVLPAKADFEHARDRTVAENLARRYQREAAAAGRSVLTPEELRTLLETRTHLPSAAIEDAVPKPKRVTLGPISPDDATALAAEDFAGGIGDVLRTPARDLPQTSPAPTASPRNARAPRPHLGQ